MNNVMKFFLDCIEEDKKNGTYKEPPPHEDLRDIIMKANGLKPSTIAERKLEEKRVVDFWEKEFEGKEE